MSENWGLLGHEWAVELLKGHLRGGTPRHAYLFTGPKGVGRRTLAIRLAQALNCPQPRDIAEPCGTCRTCRLLDRMEHPDLSVVQAERIGGTLKVDQVRELQQRLHLATYEAEHRIALLLRFEEANLNAANAMLKTLEEPPAKVVLMLTAESAEALLPTITSRCEILKLRPLPLKTTSRGLHERWGLVQEEANLLAHVSGGRPGYALRLRAEPEQMQQRTIWLDDQQRLLSANRVVRFDYAAGLSKDKEEMENALQVWLSFWRDVLLRVSGARSPLINPDREEEIEHLTQRVGRAAAKKVVATLENTLSLLKTNVNPRLALEVLLLELPRI